MSKLGVERVQVATGRCGFDLGDSEALSTSYIPRPEYDLELERTPMGTTEIVTISHYHNTSAYVSYPAFHGRHTFQGWLMTEQSIKTSYSLLYATSCGRRKKKYSVTIYAPEDTQGGS
jgi:hypothetical protein